VDQLAAQAPSWGVNPLSTGLAGAAPGRAGHRAEPVAGDGPAGHRARGPARPVPLGQRARVRPRRGGLAERGAAGCAPARARRRRAAREPDAAPRAVHPSRPGALEQTATTFFRTMAFARDCFASTAQGCPTTGQKHQRELCVWGGEQAEARARRLARRPPATRSRATPRRGPCQTLAGTRTPAPPPTATPLAGGRAGPARAPRGLSRGTSGGTRAARPCRSRRSWPRCRCCRAASGRAWCTWKPSRRAAPGGPGERIQGSCTFVAPASGGAWRTWMPSGRAPPALASMGQRMRGPSALPTRACPPGHAHDGRCRSWPEPLSVGPVSGAPGRHHALHAKRPAVVSAPATERSGAWVTRPAPTACPQPGCSARSPHEQRQGCCEPCAPPPTPLHLTRVANVHGPACRSAAGPCSRPRSRKRRPSSCPPWPAWAGTPRLTCPRRRRRPPRPGGSGRGGAPMPRRRRGRPRPPRSPRRRRAGAAAGMREKRAGRMRAEAARRARATAAQQHPRQARPCRRAAPCQAPAYELAMASRFCSAL
jgi:hypothetical protein